MTDVLIEVQLISMHSNRILSSYNPKIINNRLQFQIHRNTLEMYAHKYINLIVDIYDISYKMFTTILSQINCSDYLNDRIIGLRIQILKNTWVLLFFFTIYNFKLLNGVTSRAWNRQINWKTAQHFWVHMKRIRLVFYCIVSSWPAYRHIGHSSPNIKSVKKCWISKNWFSIFGLW